jgi:RNA polymerase sigma-70 factor (ECF subfamily)
MDTEVFAARLPAALPRLRSAARRMIGHPQETEDVLQEALLRATRSLEDFREQSALETWLFSIVTRTAIDHLRARRRFRAQVMIDACDERGRQSMGHAFTDPSVSFDVNEHIAFCFGCIGRTLEPEESVALVLREVIGLGNDESAKACGVSEPIFRHRLTTARTTMAGEYEGLCALVNKDGPCHQCKTLREVAPAAQKGPALPSAPLTWDARTQIAGASGGEGTSYDSLRDYFARVSTEMNDAR